MGTEDWPTYTNAQAGFSIAYPTGWGAQEQLGADGNLVATFGPGDGPAVVVQVGAVTASLSSCITAS